jgi:cephalosporin hydroxylase
MKTTSTDHDTHPESGSLERYHRWYYDSGVWETVRFLGVPCLKSVSDMWNYQEVIAELKPALIIEFGTRYGGSALYFAAIARLVNPQARVLTVDVDDGLIDPRLHGETAIEFLQASSTDPAVAARITALRESLPGPVFAILDSDHAKQHVLAEMLALRPLLVPGDYLIVEDGNINGHPVLPGWGEGPYEAIAEYSQRHPGDYRADLARERKFGFSFAPCGYLIRQ